MEEDKDKKIDYLTVLIEDMRSDFKVFGEGLSDVSQKVDVLTEKVGLLTEDMDYVKLEIVEIKDRFKETDEALEKKAEKEAVSDHETRIIKLEKVALAKA
jgi:hypothetical protein